jgi:hypothetical protein
MSANRVDTASKIAKLSFVGRVARIIDLSTDNKNNKAPLATSLQLKVIKASWF